MLLRATVQCSAGGKGFGDRAVKNSSKAGKRKETAGVNTGDAKAVQRAVRLVEEQEGRGRGAAGARPVDPREASRGKVEYVRVKDWGSGKPEELGSLQVDADSRVYTAGGGEGGAPAMPFHEALARRLEVLQTQGALGVAQLKGSKPLPPFERWAFARQHYAEYLADLHAVHAALEASLAAAAAAEPAAGSSSQVLAGLQLFSREQGLDRGSALLQDLQHLLAAGQQQQQQQQGGATSSGSSSSSSGVGAEAASGAAALALPAPTQHAAAYAAYIASLARLCTAAEGPAEWQEAALRLLAHSYILHLMHLTSGGRIAAAAAQRLDLVAIDALSFHRDYSALEAAHGAGAKPLEVLVSATNRLGQLLPEDQQEALMQELPKAMTKTSMLLVPLAREA